jgi:hypothetical protein
VSSILAKLNVRDRTRAVLKALDAIALAGRTVKDHVMQAVMFGSGTRRPGRQLRDSAPIRRINGRKHNGGGNNPPPHCLRLSGRVY